MASPSPCFNPRARVERDRTPWRRSARPPGFNPRARVGRDDIQNAYQGFAKQFQSTRLRGARPDGAVQFAHGGHVSIHAPAWGATHAREVDGGAPPGFNPRARAGRDRCRWRARAPSGGFNPRARAGRDAPPWPARTRWRCFNPRARVGRDML